jgi:hypothetical protein
VTLRLWLPGYHTPSLNRTQGRHWTVAQAGKQEVAREVLKALPVGATASLALARKVLLLLQAGGAVAKKVAALHAASRLEVREGLTRVHYVRVTCAPLDAENFVGSTKALTDCLRYAFPAMLPDDRPEDVEITHTQERCASRIEEGTWVHLTAVSNTGSE